MPRSFKILYIRPGIIAGFFVFVNRINIEKKVCKVFVRFNDWHVNSMEQKWKEWLAY